MSLEEWMLGSLALLFIKHWYIDFVNQSMEEVHSKGIYGDFHGIMHSVKHGVGTLIVFGIMGENFVGAIFLGIIDSLIHYHTDWAKININRARNYTIETKEFWVWLGADQLVHSLTYLGLIYLVTV